MRVHTAASLLSLLTVITTPVAAHLQEHAAFHKSALVAARDVRTEIDDTSTDGERHDEMKAPKGSTFGGFPVGNDGEEIAGFWSDDMNEKEAKHAFIMIHGRLRDGDDYFTTMHDILESAQKANHPGADDSAIIVAPQFFSKKLNSGQYTDDMLAWDDVNAWQAGDPANHPKDTKLTSFDALDALVENFMDEDKYPSMKNITVVGHGGGGQLSVRYAMVAKTPAKGNAHIRYIHGDPSSAAYFTEQRVKSVSGGEDLPSKDDCDYYDTWRYGFQDFTGTADGLKKPIDYFKQYISRDVISIVGYDDTETGGDTLCGARMQGGSKRRDRNLIWWQYVNTLAKTNEDLDGFPGTFGDDIPDWSEASNSQINMRLAVVEDAGHDAEEVFSGKVGRASLFDTDVPTGWRPDGWKAAKPIEKKSTSSDESTATATSDSSSATAAPTNAPPPGMNAQADDTLEETHPNAASKQALAEASVFFGSLAALAMAHN